MRKNSKILKILAIIALIFLVLTLPIRSLNSKAENNTTPLLFLGNHKIAPIVYEQNGVTQGIAVDLVKTFEEKIDHQIEVRALDWVEAQSKVLTGQADACRAYIA